MRDFLKKTEFTFALKVSILLGMIIVASNMKQDNKKIFEKSLVKNVPIELPTTVFSNF